MARNIENEEKVGSEKDIVPEPVLEPVLEGFSMKHEGFFEGAKSF